MSTKGDISRFPSRRMIISTKSSGTRNEMPCVPTSSLARISGVGAAFGVVSTGMQSNEKYLFVAIDEEGDKHLVHRTEHLARG